METIARVSGAEWTGPAGERTRYLELTPALAQEWLERYPYDKQRPLHTERVEAYAMDMLHGLFGPSDFHFVVLDDWRAMVNGMHRCRSVLRSNSTVQARVHDIPIKSKEDAGVVYGWFDNGGQRTASEILLALGTQISPGLLPVTQAACNLIMSGFELLTRGSGLRLRSSTTFEIKRRLIEEWAPYARAYLDLISSQGQGRRRLFQRQSVMSVGMVNLRYEEERAIPWWRQLIANDQLSEGTVRHSLNALLTEKKATAYLHYVWARHVAHAWNLDYDRPDQLRKSIRAGTAAIRSPILIRGVGSPYDGKTIHAYGFDVDAAAP